MQIDLFDFDLPESHIAQTAISNRDHSKLMVVNKKKNSVSHERFYSIGDFLDANSVLVLNNSKVFNARLIGTKHTKYIK